MSTTRPIQAVTLALMLAVSASATSSTASAQDTLRVPQDFETIQAAADSAQDGDTILVSKGIYEETVEIHSLNDISLIGKGRPVVLGGGAVEEDGEDGTGGIAIFSSNNILVRGFVLRDSGPPGVAAYSSNGITIFGCTVEGDFLSDGIRGSSSSDIVIERCKVIGGLGTAIALSSSDEVDILRCRITDAGDDGIHVASSSNVHIEKVKMSGIGDDGITISSNSFHDSSVHVEKTKISDVGDDGIAVSGAYSDLTVVKTKIVGCGGRGIDHVAKALTIEKSLIRSTGSDAVKASPIAGPPAESEDAAPVDGPVNITLLRALKVDCGLFLEANGAVVDHITVKDAESDGIVVCSSADVTLAHAKMVNVSRLSVRFETVTNSTLSDSRIVRSKKTGIDIDSGSSGNVIERTRIVAPAEFGIVAGGNGDTYTENVVRKAGKIGFDVDGSGNTFTGNSASQSGQLDLEDSAGVGANTYEDNSFGTEQIDT